MPYQVDLDIYKGPLDLLLHLIKKHEMDIYDIPISEITNQYLAALDTMKSLNLDVAGEFLVMASTLVHIKSRMLLPLAPDPDGEEEEVDPRAELVHRLLEYQRYREAAADLDECHVLGRDVFARSCVEEDSADRQEAELQPVGIYELVEVLRDLFGQAPPEPVHEVGREKLSVEDRVNLLLEALAGAGSLAFETLLSDKPTREELVVTFLAMLELVKLRMVRIMQNVRYGSIWLFEAEAGEERERSLRGESFGYC